VHAGAPGSDAACRYNRNLILYNRNLIRHNRNLIRHNRSLILHNRNLVLTQSSGAWLGCAFSARTVCSFLIETNMYSLP